MAGCCKGDPRSQPPPQFLASGRRPVLLAVLALLLGASLALSPPAAATAEQHSRNSALTAANWSLLLEGEWMVKFFAPWCSACQQIEAEWEDFAQSSTALHIAVGNVDVTQEPGLSGRFFVTTLPTIFHAKDGVFRKYRGSRTSEDLQSYIVGKKWEVVEPVTGWKSPSSITMYGMAGLFHLSGWIRQIHSYFTGPLGIPVWGSYIIFILATLFIGLFLGLILVLLADCLCPPKPRYRVERSEVNEKENVELSDEEQEPLEEKKDLSDIDDEGNNGSDRASGEDSAVDDGSEAGEQVEDITEQLPVDTEADSSVRQRKSPVAEDEE